LEYSSKIGLGTVQFGLSYGISNSNGPTSLGEIPVILNCARHFGIDVLDTASAYGTSEQVLGKNYLAGFKIVTKFMPPSENSSIRQQLNRSIDLLNVKCIYGYLAHRPECVIKAPELWTEMSKFKDLGLVMKIGFSFNEPNEIEEVLFKGWMPDIVQVPFNYFDNRFYPYLNKLKDSGCEIHTRSAFLQGLFFMPPEKLPSFFDSVKPAIRKLQLYGDNLPKLLLKYCLNQEGIDKVIIGVNNANQLLSNLNYSSVKGTLPDLLYDLPDEILIPSKWNLRK